MDTITVAVLSGSMAAASYIDLRRHRIPNLLTYTAMALLLAYSSATGGLAGLVFSAKGLLLGMGLLLPLYIMGGMGAGDAKLLGVAGAGLGASGVFTAFIFTALAGGAYAAGILLLGGIWRDGFRSRLRSLLGLASAELPACAHAAAPAGRPKLCYGIPIAIGTACAIAWRMAFNSFVL